MPMTPSEKLFAVICCPGCHARFTTSRDSSRFDCHKCGVTAERQATQIRCGGFTVSDVNTDWLNQVKESAKRLLGTRYKTAIELISPVYAGFMNRRIKKYLSSFDLQNQFVADLGAGPLRHDPDLICCDGMNYASVNLVTDLEHLPLPANSLDGVMSVAVLEHVTDPRAHVNEMLRVLKPGGRAMVYIPFIVGYHASPYDYHRLTISGMKQLFNDFELVSVEPGAGPTSGMLWIVQEWLAMVLSFGITPLYKLIMPMTYILSPIKYLDIILRHHPAAANIESGFVIEVRKPG